jgi:dTDP-4-dehydrorhamnose reductase
MRILLFGKHGQVGRALVPLLRPVGDVTSLGHRDLDVADTDQLRALLRTQKPDIVINACAYTNVDRAESEKEIAWQVNAEAPALMMQELNQWRGILIHFSTDYVFDGITDRPYVEGDVPNPINEYGRSKLGGEQLIAARGERYLILRTGWVYAAGMQNFISNILRWAVTEETLRIVDDQIGSPTWATMLAEQVAALLLRRTIFDLIQGRAGIYHCVGKGAVSRYDLARKVLSLISSHTRVKTTVVTPVKSSDFSLPAVRPGYSALDCTKFELTFGLHLPTWEFSLFHALQQFEPESAK